MRLHTKKAGNLTAGMIVADPSITIVNKDQPIATLTEDYEFDGQTVTSPTALQSAVDARRPGETVPVVVLRNGDRQTLEVTLDVRP